MNLNNLAREIARKEGKDIQVNIAQIKEILKITLTELAKESDTNVWLILNKYR